MKVLVAEKCGFCRGVKNAISMAQKIVAERDDVYSLGPIIHNTEVVEKLAHTDHGLKCVQNVDSVKAGTVLIRSHGATVAQLEEIKEKGLDIIDATCVLVKRVQKIARQLHEKGYRVIIIGDKNHPEVEAVVGSAPNISVMGTEKDLAELSKNSKLGIICQTTQSPDHFASMIAKIIENGFSELRIINTLCKEAIRRQQAAVRLCKKVDIMFVLGGLHSANTRKLAEICRKHNNQTFHLQNWKELDKNILSGKNVAGVTAGASTPDWIITEFVEKMRIFEPLKGK